MCPGGLANLRLSLFDFLFLGTLRITSRQLGRHEVLLALLLGYFPSRFSLWLGLLNFGRERDMVMSLAPSRSRILVAAFKEFTLLGIGTGLGVIGLSLKHELVYLAVTLLESFTLFSLL